MDLFGGVEEPAICVVSGDRIRKRIEAHVLQARAAIIAYERALADRRAGVDWQCAIDELQSRIITAELVLPVVGDGPFQMTVKQWVQVCNRFPEVQGPDQMLAAVEKRRAHEAAHAQPGKESVPS